MEESPVQKLRPTWINDNEKKCCAVCDTAFSFLNRRVGFLSFLNNCSYLCF